MTSYPNSSSIGSQQTELNRSRLSRTILNQFVAVIAIALAVVVRMGLDPILGNHHPHFTFIIAVIFVAWYGDVSSSIVAVVLGLIATMYFFQPPRWSIKVYGLDAQVATALYVVVGLSTVFFSESMHRANRRAKETAAELMRKQALLEREIEVRREAQEARINLLRRVVNIQEEERRRISRELHDQCGQILTALHIGLKCFQESIELDDKADQQFKNLQSLLEHLANEMHHLAQEVRPPALDELGLQTAVESYLNAWSTRTNSSFDLECHGMERDRVEPEIETALYRILQEALTNVAKHAGPTTVNVIIKRSESEMQLIVEDQGKGFDIESNTLSTGDRQHLGLLGMRERIAAIGGKLEFESTIGTGTTVFARVPLNKKVR